MSKFKIAAFLLMSVTMAAQSLPSGTVLPIMVGSGINAKKIKSDVRITGKIMQDVPLQDGSKIRRGARVSGHIVEVTKTAGSGSRIVLNFDQLEDHGKTYPLHAGLLALASMDSIAQAELPINADAGFGSSSNMWVTRQVGGDVVNRGRGMVGSTEGLVGKWVDSDAVLVKLTPNPKEGCPRGDGYEREQALWIFSSAACGVYGVSGVTLSNNGITGASRNVVLESGANIDIRGGSGWLLITVSKNVQ